MPGAAATTWLTRGTQAVTPHHPAVTSPGNSRHPPRRSRPGSGSDNLVALPLPTLITKCYLSSFGAQLNL